MFFTLNKVFIVFFLIMAGNPVFSLAPSSSTMDVHRMQENVFPEFASRIHDICREASGNSDPGFHLSNTLKQQFPEASPISFKDYSFHCASKVYYGIGLSCGLIEIEGENPPYAGALIIGDSQPLDPEKHTYYCKLWKEVPELKQNTDGYIEVILDALEIPFIQDSEKHILYLTSDGLAKWKDLWNSMDEVLDLLQCKIIEKDLNMKLIAALEHIINSFSNSNYQTSHKFHFLLYSLIDFLRDRMISESADFLKETGRKRGEAFQYTVHNLTQLLKRNLCYLYNKRKKDYFTNAPFYNFPTPFLLKYSLFFTDWYMSQHDQQKKALFLASSNIFFYYFLEIYIFEILFDNRFGEAPSKKDYRECMKKYISFTIDHPDNIQTIGNLIPYYFAEYHFFFWTMMNYCTSTSLTQAPVFISVISKELHFLNEIRTSIKPVLDEIREHSGTFQLFPSPIPVPADTHGNIMLPILDYIEQCDIMFSNLQNYQRSEPQPFIDKQTQMSINAISMRISTALQSPLFLPETRWFMEGISGKYLKQWTSFIKTIHGFEKQLFLFTHRTGLKILFIKKWIRTKIWTKFPLIAHYNGLVFGHDSAKVHGEEGLAADFFTMAFQLIPNAQKYKNAFRKSTGEIPGYMHSLSLSLSLGSKYTSTDSMKEVNRFVNLYLLALFDMEGIPANTDDMTAEGSLFPNDKKIILSNIKTLLNKPRKKPEDWDMVIRQSKFILDLELPQCPYSMQAEEILRLLVQHDIPDPKLFELFSAWLADKDPRVLVYISIMNEEPKISDRYPKCTNLIKDSLNSLNQFPLRDICNLVKFCFSTPRYNEGLKLLETVKNNIIQTFDRKTPSKSIQDSIAWPESTYKHHPDLNEIKGFIQIHEAVQFKLVQKCNEEMRNLLEDKGDKKPPSPEEIMNTVFPDFNAIAGWKDESEKQVHLAYLQENHFVPLIYMETLFNQTSGVSCKIDLTFKKTRANISKNLQFLKNAERCADYINQTFCSNAFFKSDEIGPRLLKKYNSLKRKASFFQVLSDFYKAYDDKNFDAISIFDELSTLTDEYGKTFYSDLTNASCATLKKMKEELKEKHRERQEKLIKDQERLRHVITILHDYESKGENFTGFDNIESLIHELNGLLKNPDLLTLNPFNHPSTEKNLYEFAELFTASGQSLPEKNIADYIKDIQQRVEIRRILVIEELKYALNSKGQNIDRITDIQKEIGEIYKFDHGSFRMLIRRMYKILNEEFKDLLPSLAPLGNYDLEKGHLHLGMDKIDDNAIIKLYQICFITGECSKWLARKEYETRDNIEVPLQDMMDELTPFAELFSEAFTLKKIALLKMHYAHLRMQIWMENKKTEDKTKSTAKDDNKDRIKGTYAKYFDPDKFVFDPLEPNTVKIPLSNLPLFTSRVNNVSVSVLLNELQEKFLQGDQVTFQDQVLRASGISNEKVIPVFEVAGVEEANGMGYLVLSWVNSSEKEFASITRKKEKKQMQALFEPENTFIPSRGIMFVPAPDHLERQLDSMHSILASLLPQTQTWINDKSQQRKDIQPIRVQTGETEDDELTNSILGLISVNEMIALELRQGIQLPDINAESLGLGEEKKETMQYVLASRNPNTRQIYRIIFIDAKGGTGKTEFSSIADSEMLNRNTIILCTAPTHAGTDASFIKHNEKNIGPLLRLANPLVAHGIDPAVHAKWDEREIIIIGELKNAHAIRFCTATGGDPLVKKHAKGHPEKITQFWRHDVVWQDENSMSHVPEWLNTARERLKKDGTMISLGDDEQLPPYFSKQIRNRLEKLFRKNKETESMKNFMGMNLEKTFFKRSSLFSDMIQTSPIELFYNQFGTLSFTFPKNYRSTARIVKLLNAMIYREKRTPMTTHWESDVPENKQIILLDKEHPGKSMEKLLNDKHGNPSRGQYVNETEISQVLNQIHTDLNDPEINSKNPLDGSQMVFISPYKAQNKLFRASISVMSMLGELENLLSKNMDTAELSIPPEIADKIKGPMMKQITWLFESYLKTPLQGLDLDAFFAGEMNHEKIISMIELLKSNLPSFIPQDCEGMNLKRIMGFQEKNYEGKKKKEVETEAKEIFYSTTVQKVQGAQRRAVYISYVRNNMEGNLGFLFGKLGKRMQVTATGRSEELLRIAMSRKTWNNAYQKAKRYKNRSYEDNVKFQSVRVMRNLLNFLNPHVQNNKNSQLNQRFRNTIPLFFSRAA